MRRLAKSAGSAPFAVALGFVAILTGVRAIFDPSTLPLEPVLGWVAYVWAVIYALGGVLMLYGMATAEARYEAAGCSLFAGGAFTQAVATTAFLGVSPFLNFWSVVTLLAFGLAGVVRTRHLMRGQRLLWVRTRNG